jgi:hypothetical protein
VDTVSGNVYAVACVELQIVHRDQGDYGAVVALIVLFYETRNKFLDVRGFSEVGFGKLEKCCVALFDSLWRCLEHGKYDMFEILVSKRGAVGVLQELLERRKLE